MLDANRFFNYLIDNDMDFFAGVPDSLLKSFCAVAKDKSDNNIITANEGNAIALCAGYHMATGKYGVVYMQNSGLGNCVNPLLSLTDESIYSIPMLLIVGWRGQPGSKDEPQHGKQGELTLPLLDTMQIEYTILDDSYETQIQYCKDYMRKKNKPIALIVKKDSFDAYPFKPETSNYTLTRESALQTVIGELGDDEFIVSTTGKTSREVFEIREANGQGHENDFLTVGSMGHTSSIALGMSLGTDKNVYCIDGDGSFIMHMGSAGIAANNANKNFKYIMINNGAHESVGGQPTVAFDMDVEAVLKASGFRTILSATTQSEVLAGIKKLRDSTVCALVIYSKQGSRKDLGRPTTTPMQNKDAFMRKIGGKN